MRHCLFAAFISAAFVSPALAAQYYVTQDAIKKNCWVADQEPDGKTTLMIGTPHSSRAEAKAAKKAAVTAGQCVAAEDD